jgi:hypothetical protein
VFTAMSAGDAGRFPARVHETVDFGVPASKNLTDQHLRITKVTLVDPPVGTTVLNSRAYLYKDSNGVGMIAGIGNLPEICSYYRPHPVSDSTAAPHGELNAYLVIATRVDKAGRYEIGDVRIDYTLDGKPGYQIQHIGETVIVTPGPIRKFPKSYCKPK